MNDPCTYVDDRAVPACDPNRARRAVTPNFEMYRVKLAFVTGLAKRFLAQPSVVVAQLDIAEGASGSCVWASTEFLDFVQGEWPEAKVKIVEALGHPKDSQLWHCLAKVEDFYVDLTLRQVDTEALCPTIRVNLNLWRRWVEHDFPYDREPFFLDEEFTDAR